jgi:hypothetical protein
VIAGITLLDSFWYGTATMVALLLFPVPALVVTVLVALLPCRSRRAGERRSSFLPSPACRALEVGLFVASRAAIVPVIVIIVALGGYVIGIWPKSELAEDLSGVVWWIWIFVLGRPRWVSPASDWERRDWRKLWLRTPARPCCICGRSGRNPTPSPGDSKEHSHYTRRRWDCCIGG